MLASRVFTVVAMVAAARLLGKADFGALGMVQSTVGMFGVFAGMGLGVTATKYIAALRRSDTERLGRILSLVLATQAGALVLVAVVVACLASPLASSALNAPHLAQAIRLAVVLLCVLALNRLTTDALAGFEAWRLVTVVAFVQGLFTLPAVLLLARPYGVAGAIGGLALAAGASAVVGAWAVVRRCRDGGIRLRFGGMWSEAPILWHFALPATLTALTVGPVLWAANAILANTPGGYEQLGGFAAALQWKNLLMYVPAAMAAAFLPVMAHLHDSDGSGSFDRALRSQIPLVGMASLPAAMAIACCAPYVMALYGRDFAGDEALLGVVLAGAVVQGIAGSLSNALVGSGRMWLRLTIYGASGLALVAVTAVAAPTLGAMGMAIGYLASYVLHAAWLVAVLGVRRLLVPAAVLCLELAAAVVCVHLISQLPPFRAAVAGLALAVVTFGVMFATAPGELRRSLSSRSRALLAGRLLRPARSALVQSGDVQQTEADSGTGPS
jgi:O-antigen/teichoic acid export membrane protein